jgi:putative ABC transport system substrate-binding protein
MNGDMMQRRDFITLLGGSAAAWPLAARAQQPAMPVIGVLVQSSAAQAQLLDVFRRSLAEAGYVEGRNIAMVFRAADGQVDRLPELAADLVRTKVAVIVAFAGGPAALAAKEATTSIPVVFVYGSDPVRLGLVASLGRPGGNVTGVTHMYEDILPKRVELLRELVPSANVIGLLLNPTAPNNESTVKEMQTMAREGGWRLRVASADTESEVDAAFATFAQEQVQAAVVQGGPFFFRRSEQFAALELRHKIPAIYTFREITAAGGLMSYANSITEMFRLLGVYVGRILKGEKPADLPVQQPVKFELVINLKTARAHGLTVPPTLLVFANEVIE